MFTVFYKEVLMNLDIITLSIVLTIVYLISFVILIFLWKINRDEKGLLSWVLSALVAFIGFSALIVPKEVNAFHVMLNVVMVELAMILLVIGVLQFRRFIKKVEYVYLIPLLTMFTLYAFYTQNTPASRYLVLDAVMVIGAILCAFFMSYKTTKHEKILFLFASIIFLMIVPLFGYRWYLAASGSILNEYIGLTNFTITRLIFLAAIPWMLSYTFSFAVIINFRTVERMKILTYHDYLTGLKNRRAMDQVMAEKIKHQTEFNVMMIDLNNFKRINDEYGHTVGDEVLAHIASLIMSKLTPLDHGFRLGGDEFIVLSDVASPLNFEGFIKHIRTLSHDGFEFKTHRIFIESSIGVSNYPKDGSTIDELLSKADQQMYGDKRQLKESV